MTIIQNTIIEGKHEKPILTDVFYKATKQSKPIVIFAHGYKGFKDWGCWNLVAEQFATNNFFFVKFNFSHNGGTAKQPIDFPDLEAFGNNNYTIELDDLQSVIDWVLKNEDFRDEVDKSNITLIGHSRGGGISILKAREEKRVTRLITWAAVSNFGDRSATIRELEDWKNNGVKYVLNGRTKQQMPHYFQFYENYKSNKTRLNIELAVKNLEIPFLIIHGTNDTSISFDEAKLLHDWNLKSEISDIKDANHTFGGKHPWTKNHLPKHLQKVTTQSLDFIKS